MAIGADHAGFQLKVHLRAVLQGAGVQVSDLGTGTPESADYPPFGHAVALEVAEGRVDYGILVCGTGIGMAMAANRHNDVRAAVCHSPEEATYSRSHNNANILCLGARLIGAEAAEKVMHIFLSTDFEGGRHARRVKQLEQ